MTLKPQLVLTGATVLAIAAMIWIVRERRGTPPPIGPGEPEVPVTPPPGPDPEPTDPPVVLRGPEVPVTPPPVPDPEPTDPPVVPPEPETPPPPPTRPYRDLEAFVRRVNEAPTWRGASVTIAEIGKLPTYRGREVALELFRRVVDAYKRQKAFDDLVLRVRPPWILDLLDAMATDPESSVRRAAYAHLHPIAFRRFTDDDDAYRTWRNETIGRPVGEVWRMSLRAFVDRLHALDDAAFSKELASMPLQPGLAGLDAAACAKALDESGAVDLLLSRLTRTESGDISFAARRQGWTWISKARLESERAKRWLAPVFARPDAFPRGTVGGALEVLGAAEGLWPKEALAKVTAQELGMMHGGTLGKAWMGHLEDPAVIPLLIEALGTEGIPAFNARLTARLLAQATGAKEGADKDAAWWRNWLERNR